jgi:hypothetical protein
MGVTESFHQGSKGYLLSCMFCFQYKYVCQTISFAMICLTSLEDQWLLRYKAILNSCFPCFWNCIDKIVQICSKAYRQNFTLNFLNSLYCPPKTLSGRILKNKSYIVYQCRVSLHTLSNKGSKQRRLASIGYNTILHILSEKITN